MSFAVISANGQDKSVSETGNAAPSKRRIPPSPFDSPPFPSGDWQIGGTPVIGDPGTLPTYPLMEAIYASPSGESVEEKQNSNLRLGKFLL